MIDFITKWMVRMKHVKFVAIFLVLGSDVFVLFCFFSPFTDAQSSDKEFHQD
jgi:hypothetical protein